MLDNRPCDLIGAALNTSEEEWIRLYTLTHFAYYTNNVNYLMNAVLLEMQ